MQSGFFFKEKGSTAGLFGPFQVVDFDSLPSPRVPDSMDVADDWPRRLRRLSVGLFAARWHRGEACLCWETPAFIQCSPFNRVYLVLPSFMFRRSVGTCPLYLQKGRLFLFSSGIFMDNLNTIFNMSLI